MDGFCGESEIEQELERDGKARMKPEMIFLFPSFRIINTLLWADSMLTAKLCQKKTDTIN